MMSVDDLSMVSHYLPVAFQVEDENSASCEMRYFAVLAQESRLCDQDGK